MYTLNKNPLHLKNVLLTKMNYMINIFLHNLSFKKNKELQSPTVVHAM
jgi:hypothetical protein